MKKVVVGTLFTVLMFASWGASAIEWINRIPLENMIPPPLPRGSTIEQQEIEEILKTQAEASRAARIQARRDNDTEDGTIFASTLGPAWNLSNLLKTKFLIDRIMDVDRPDSSTAKHFFRRPRPRIVDSKIQTCAGHDSGPAENSYPSGHTMLGYEIGVVLASSMPNHAQAILARASQYGESRFLCDVHFSSDVTAGEQFGTVLAVEMMQHSVFPGWFVDAQLELKRAGLAR